MGQSAKAPVFHNNTRILDEGLDYLATGFDIFKGWLIVTVVLVLFYALPMLGIPFLQEGFSLLLVFAIHGPSTSRCGSMREPCVARCTL